MSLQTTLWALRRTLGLSPTQRLFRDLAARGVRVREMRALEVFAHCGFLHTRDYHARVAGLEAWEIDPAQEPALRRNLPGAAVKITDSYEEIRRTPHRYDLILLDAPDVVHGDRGQYCEHFHMLPEVFRAAEDSAVLIVNVVPGFVDGKPRRLRFGAAHLEYRRRFYGTDHPERVPLKEMVPVYRRVIEAHGFELEWCFSRRRTSDGRVHYLVLKVNRKGRAAEVDGGPAGAPA